AFLHLSVALQGKDFLSEQALWLDRIEIVVDGKNMTHFPARNLIREPLKMKDITPLSFTDSMLYDRIPELKTKRIFALGETVHGSGSIFDVAFQIAKHQVEKNSCRLILLELPIEDMLSVNRFIQGDASFEIDSLMFRYFNFAYYGTDLKKMFLWLKAYNKRNSEKVWIMGMDYEYRKEESIMSLYDYLYAINQSLQSPAIDSLCYHVLTAIGNSSKVEEFLQLAESLAKRKDIASLIGEKEFEIFRHVLTVSGKYGASTAKRLDSRDSVMYENTDFLLNFLCNKDEKAFVLAHFGHVNYKGLPVIPNRHHISFGSLMKENYGTDYFCTGVLVGTGDFATTGDSTITIRPLQSPPLGSLEYLFGQARNNYFYIPESAIPQPIACIRLIGNVDSEEAFKPWSVRSRMDAAIYIQNSKASAIPSEIQDNPDILRGRNPSVMMSRLTKYFERDRICNLKMQQRGIK
ncbi:MAG: erythromycin esterase family protein, partial [Candidatus Symbiothrix sp.]|nr:erythromycin esterase family protein [Candidatus Symbiothrix sp.]